MLFDKELPTEEVTELRALETWDAPLETSLVPEETEEPATSARLEADPEMTEAADLTLPDAFSATPGSVPMTDDET